MARFGSPITATIICKNEAELIGECLESLDFCAEIISTIDATTPVFDISTAPGTSWALSTFSVCPAPPRNLNRVPSVLSNCFVSGVESILGFPTNVPSEWMPRLPDMPRNVGRGTSAGRANAMSLRGKSMIRWSPASETMTDGRSLASRSPSASEAPC